MESDVCTIRNTHYASILEVKPEQTELFNIVSTSENQPRNTQMEYERNELVPNTLERSPKPDTVYVIAETQKCDVCFKDFKKRSYMLRHKKRHTDERNYKCDVCSMLFTTQIYMTKHMKTHTVDRKYQCEVCSRSFKLRPGLMKHVLIHTTERNHKCEICMKIFKTKQCLQSHVQIHNEREHRCEICSKTFSTRKYLAVHRQVHAESSKFRCDVCDKVFKIRGCLWQHMKIHIDEGSHKCEVCARVYNTRGHMLQHMKRHTNKNKYEGSHSCKVCSRRFKSMRAVSAHMKSHAKKTFAWKSTSNLKIPENEFDLLSTTSNVEQDSSESIQPSHEQIKTEPMDRSDLLYESNSPDDSVVAGEAVEIKCEISNTNIDDLVVNTNGTFEGTIWNIDAKLEVDDVEDSYKNEECRFSIFANELV